MAGAGIVGSDVRQTNRSDEIEAARIEIVRNYNRRIESIEDDVDEASKDIAALKDAVADLAADVREDIADNQQVFSRIARDIEYENTLRRELAVEVDTIAAALSRLEGRFINEPARADHTHEEMFRLLIRPSQVGPQWPGKP